jgi:hypothetical protein
VTGRKKRRQSSIKELRAMEIGQRHKHGKSNTEITPRIINRDGCGEACCLPKKRSKENIKSKPHLEM